MYLFVQRWFLLCEILYYFPSEVFSFIENNILFVSVFWVRGEMSRWLRVVLCVFIFAFPHCEISFCFTNKDSLKT